MRVTCAGEREGTRKRGGSRLKLSPLYCEGIMKKVSALLSYLLPYIIRDELLQWTARFRQGDGVPDREGNRLHAPNMGLHWRLLPTACGRCIVASARGAHQDPRDGRR